MCTTLIPSRLSSDAVLNHLLHIYPFTCACILDSACEALRTKSQPHPNFRIVRSAAICAYEAVGVEGYKQGGRRMRQANRRDDSRIVTRFQMIAHPRRRRNAREGGQQHNPSPFLLRHEAKSEATRHLRLQSNYSPFACRSGASGPPRMIATTSASIKTCCVVRDV